MTLAAAQERLETGGAVDTRPWANVPQFPGVIGTFMGRDALALAVSYLDLQPDDTVLLPAFTCEEVIRPFRGRTRITFYGVGPELAADPDEIRAKLSASRARAMLVIHYFGFLQPYREEIQRICREQGTWLIEDCAHSLLTAGSGETGDLAVYSFRKIIPLPDGGGLRVNRAAKAVAPSFYPKLYSSALSLAIAAKSRLHLHAAAFSRAGLTSSANSVLSNGTPPAAGEHLLPLSGFARRGLAAASLADIVQRRREDYGYWQKLAPQNGLAPQFGALPAEVCPLGFPARAKNRDSLYERARSQGIYLKVHWRLSPALAAECGGSVDVSRETITLPVYPELGARDRETLTKIIAGK
jgi:perosamine synthetase